MRPRFLLPLLLAGIVAVWRTRGASVAALCVTTLLAVIAASMAGRYPVAGRLLLFLAPFVLLLTGSAVAALFAPLERRWDGAVAVAALLLVTAMLNTRLTRLWRLQPTTEGRGAVAAVTGAHGHEPVYVAPGAANIWAYYSTDWTHPDFTYLDSIAHLTSSGGVAFIAGPSRHARVRADEGRGLVFDRNGGRELIGLRTGNPSRASGASSFVPDSGWVEEEVSRMLATCDRHLWIISAIRVKTEAEPLLRALLSAGSRVVYRFDELQASAFRLELPAQQADGCLDATPKPIADRAHI
jgi:hypothetical protein